MFTRPAMLIPLHILLLVALAVTVYQGTLDAPFVFDDNIDIVLNDRIHAHTPRDLLAALLPPYVSERPLANLTFAVNYYFDGLKVAGYHWTNIVIHCLNGILLYAFIATLPQAVIGLRYRRSALMIAFLATAVWLLNPVQTQAVTYVVQRMTSLATLFYLLALWLFVLYRTQRLAGRTTFVGIAMCFVLGMASKQIVITMPLAIWLVDSVLFSRSPRPRAWVWVSAVMVMALTSWVFLHDHAISWFETYPGRNFSPVERLLTEPRVLWHYLSLFFFPGLERLQVDYDIVVSRELWRPGTTLPAILGWVAVATTAWRFRVPARLPAFGILFFLLAASLEASFVNIELAFIHRIYLPSLFLSLGVFSALSHLPKQGATNAVAMLVIAFLGTTTAARNAEWANPAALWSADLRRGASESRGHLNQAIALYEQGHSQQALALVQPETSAASESQRFKFDYLRGLAQIESGDLETARLTFDELLIQYGDWDGFVLQAANIRFGVGEMEEAKAFAARLPDTPKGRIYREIILARHQSLTGSPQRGAHRLQAVLQRIPHQWHEHRQHVRLELANVFLQLRQFDAAYALYREIVRESPHQFAAWRQLYRMQSAAGDHANAARIKNYLVSKGISPGKDWDSSGAEFEKMRQRTDSRKVRDRKRDLTTAEENTQPSLGPNQ